MRTRFVNPSATPDERLYVRSRVFSNLVLFLVVALGLPNADGYMAQTLVVISTLGTLYLLAAAWRGRLDAAIIHVLVPDLVALAGYTYLFHELEDAFFPLAVLQAVSYALLLNRKQALLVGLACAFAYSAGHIGHDLTPVEVIVYFAKTLSIPAIAMVVAISVERQQEREREASEAVAARDVLTEQMQRRISELQAVSEITEVLHSSLDFERVGPIVLEILARVVGVTSCSLFLIDKERSDRVFSINYRMQGTIGYSVAGELDTSGVAEHFSCTTVFDHADTMVIFCAPAEEIHDLSDENRLVLGAAASEIVVAVENSRLYKLTKTLAVTDELTTLNNYRFLQQRLDEEIERARRYAKRLSLLMIDVDDFKLFNDGQGHITGDTVLAELGGVLRSVVREVDTVARYGGEEFSVVLPETDAAGAFITGEKIREAVAEHLFSDAKGSRTCRLTVSVGVATFPTHAWDKESLLREADNSLYEAKDHGKNRVRAPRPDSATRHEKARSTEESTDVQHFSSQDEWTGA